MNLVRVIATIRFSVLHPSQVPNLRTANPSGFHGPVQSSVVNQPFESIVTVFASLAGNGSIEDVIDYLDRLSSGSVVVQGVAEVQMDGYSAVISYDHDCERWIVERFLDEDVGILLQLEAA